MLVLLHPFRGSEKREAEQQGSGCYGVPCLFADEGKGMRRLREGGPRWELRKFTTSQLVEELACRQNESTSAKPEHWCHDCANYAAWDERPRKGEMPESFNPCTKGHAMRFIVPEQIDDAYGYYRAVCVDRAELESI